MALKFFDKVLKDEQGEKIKVFLFGNTFLLLFSLFMFIIYKVTSAFNLVLCPMKNLLHLFCPFCGGSRCAFSLFQLDFKSAFMYHPSTALLMIYAIIVELAYIYDIVFKKDIAKKIFRVDITLAVYIILSAIQYAVRIYCFYNNIECPIMYTDI